MRAAQALSGLFVLGLMIYVVSNFASVQSALGPMGGKLEKEEPAKPLAEAAPEVAALRGGMRQLAAEALKAVPLCVNRSEKEDLVRPRGRVLVWDVTEDDVSEAHGRLPAALRVQSVDDPCTVFLITERERTHVLDYNYDFFHGGGATGVKGFRTDLIVCVVDLPSRQPRGRYRLSGEGPANVVELKPNRKEVDGDWGGTLKDFICDCAHGPEKQYVASYNQMLHRQADAAREGLGECELLGSLPTLGKFPRKATIYNLQTDRLHPANSFVRSRADQGAESRLLVLPLDERLVLDSQSRNGRFVWRVALFAFPNAEPLGVYYVNGESWPVPKKPGETWADDPTTNKTLRNPHQALARWVDDVCKVKGGLPRGTVAVSADAELLAGTEWLQGPGWLKRAKRPPLPKAQQGWEKMAEDCSDQVKACRALGPAAPPASLPKKIVVWTDHSESFVPSPAQEELPRALQAGSSDTNVLMALIVESHFVQLPKDTRTPTKERWDYDVALFTMPGARPIGTYRVEGETLPVDRPRVGRNARHHNVNRDVAAWLEKFMDDPQKMARN